MNLTSDDEQNWVLLRERSLQPGGFGEDRVRIWPALLGAQPLSDPPPYSEEDSVDEYGDLMEQGTSEPMADPHADERQIKLDTDRSFVLYPGESGTTLARDALQSDLLELLVSLFRKRRSLHYFQGFHDIMTVLFLTLPQPLHLACAEKMALYRVRDAMGVGLEPILGLLRVLRNLLRLVDPAYAKLLENCSPLPYHALSHLLTLFSHDIPTLPLIQHAWDFLLSREPIAVVWLAAALVLYRKPSVYLLAEQDEEGMIHSLLGGLPELVDAEPEHYDRCDGDLAQDTFVDVDRAVEDGITAGKPTTGSHPNVRGTGLQEHSTDFDGTLGSNINGQTHISRETSTGDEDELNQSAIPLDVVQDSDNIRASGSSPHSKSLPLPEETGQDSMDRTRRSTLELATLIALPDSRPASPVPSPVSSTPVQLVVTLPQEARYVDNHHNPSSSTSDHALPRSRSSFSDMTCPSPPMQSPTVANGHTSHFDRSGPSKARTKPAPLSLTYLLRQADDLLTTYPPSHPLLRVAEIMGPDSAMRTWRPLPLSTEDGVPEKHPYNETDDYWENLANSPRTVIPSPPPSPPPGPRLSRKKTGMSPRASRKALLDPRRVGLRLGALTPAERRVLFMGALLVVGAAVALRSSKMSCVDGIVKGNGGEGLKRLWNGKWTLMSSVIAAWGRGLP